MSDESEKELGRLEVITGCMFCGKSEELIRRIDRAEVAGQKVILFKPSIDDRYSEGAVVTHYGREFNAKCIPTDITSIISLKIFVEEGEVEGADIVAFDEGNFFSKKFPRLTAELIQEGKRVIVAGLDLTFAGDPFYPMPDLMADSDRLDKLHAVCNECGDEATRTQRLTEEGEPAPADGPIIKVGGKESYQARCRDCWELG